MQKKTCRWGESPTPTSLSLQASFCCFCFSFSAFQRTIFSFNSTAEIEKNGVFKDQNERWSWYKQSFLQFYSWRKFTRNVLRILLEIFLPGLSISSVSGCLLNGSLGVESRCLLMCLRSITWRGRESWGPARGKKVSLSDTRTFPEVGSRTGSSISSHIMGSAK